MHTPEDIARVRAELRATQDARLNDRIRALRTQNRLPIRQIAGLVGVSIAYIEALTGEASPEGLV
jgi:hypothetical protein